MKPRFWTIIVSVLVWIVAALVSDASSQAIPAIHVLPEDALVDEKVNIRLSGLAPHRSVTLRVSMNDARGSIWRSSESVFLVVSG